MVTATQSLTTSAIEAMAKAWYAKLDVHAPLVDILPMLSADGDLAMVFPEATLEGLTGFEGWYEGVIRIFFDEVHNVTEVTSEINGTTAVVKVVVHWEASRWNSPAATSDRIILDAYQTWNVKLSETTGNIVVTKYIVDDIKYCEGSATL
jgi:hypothetical protein